MVIFQVTIPTGGGPVQFPALQFQPQTLVLGVSGSNVMRVGDVTTSTTKGIPLQSKTVTVISLGQDYSTRTDEWWAAGVAADVLDVMVI